MSLGYSRITGATGGRGNGHHSQSLKTTSSASGNSFLSGSKDIKVMALCELIKGDKFIKKNNDIWVVPDDRTMVTRFLFVFAPGASDFQQVYAQANQCRTHNNTTGCNVSFEKEIRECIQMTWGHN
jgi:hypothetical protein